MTGFVCGHQYLELSPVIDGQPVEAHDGTSNTRNLSVEFRDAQNQYQR